MPEKLNHALGEEFCRFSGSVVLRAVQGELGRVLLSREHAGIHRTVQLEILVPSNANNPSIDAPPRISNPGAKRSRPSIDQAPRHWPRGRYPQTEQCFYHRSVPMRKSATITATPLKTHLLRPKSSSLTAQTRTVSVLSMSCPLENQTAFKPRG